MVSSRPIESILIVGGGIVGLAAAHRLQQAFVNVQITVLEKENAPGQHQSTHISGVLHAGLYYKPGSAKARLAVRGIRQMTAFCKEHGIAHEICGKLVVAVNDAEVGRLQSLFERGSANGLRGLRNVSRDEMREIEPHAAGLKAIHVPEEGIVDYAGVIAALSRVIQSNGARLVTGARATRLFRDGNDWVAVTPKGEFRADFLLNTAGLY